MLNQKLRERLQARVIVSTKNDHFFLMIDTLLGGLAESVMSIGSVAPAGGENSVSERSKNSQTLAIIDVSTAAQAKEDINRVRKLLRQPRIMLVSRPEVDNIAPLADQVSAIIPFSEVANTLVHVTHVVLEGMSVLMHLDCAQNGLKDIDHDLERLRSLSPTELRVMLALTEGLSNKQIGRVINISDNTVRIHVRNIFLKLGVKNRTQAALFATRHLNSGVLLEKIEPLRA